jgi:hypothetical protein
MVKKLPPNYIKVVMNKNNGQFLVTVPQKMAYRKHIKEGTIFLFCYDDRQEDIVIKICKDEVKR